MRWKITLNQVLKAYNKQAKDNNNKSVRFGTQSTRREILESGFLELRRLGYKLPDVRGFKERHMTALGHAWEARHLSSATLQNRISIFRIFAEWIGKKGMIRDSIYYVKNPESVKRKRVVKTDKTWQARQRKLAEKLEGLRQKDPYVAMQVELQCAFRLCMKEAALLKPDYADKVHYLLINRGTRGGHNRIVRIETDYQKEVLARAKRLLPKESSMTPANYSFKQWRSHYYHVCRKCGLGRKEGITHPTSTQTVF